MDSTVHRLIKVYGLDEGLQRARRQGCESRLVEVARRFYESGELDLVVRCRQKIPSGREPPAPLTRRRKPRQGVPTVGVAPLVVRCRRKIPFGRVLLALIAGRCQPGRGYQASASHH